MDKDLNSENKINKGEVHTWMEGKGITVESYLQENGLPSYLAETVNEMIIFRETVARLCELQIWNKKKDLALESHSFRMLLSGLFTDNEIHAEALKTKLTDDINNLYVQWYNESQNPPKPY